LPQTLVWQEGQVYLTLFFLGGAGAAVAVGELPPEIMTM